MKGIIIILFFTLLVAMGCSNLQKPDTVPQRPSEEEIVKSGCIGDCGGPQRPVPIMEYVVDSKNALIIARLAESSLCPSTGVYVFLFKNGKEVANGHLHSKGDSIQTTAEQGDKINVYAMDYPLFNSIECIQQGNLKFNLIKRIL